MRYAVNIMHFSAQADAGSHLVFVAKLKFGDHLKLVQPFCFILVKIAYVSSQ